MPAIVTSAQQHALSDIGASTDLDNYAVASLVAAQPTARLVGSHAGVGVVDVVSASRAGVRESAFSDIFYNRIWVIPKHTNLGNIVANQTFQIELWNAYFSAQTLESYSVTGDVDVTGLASGTLNPLQSLLYSVSVALVGTPTLEATIEWVFTTDTKFVISATIDGQRVIPFLLRHNWADPVVEQVTFKTDVLVATSGKEQRLGLTSEPRRRIEMTYLTLTPEERAYIEHVLFGWHGRTFAIPLWADYGRITASTTVGATVFSTDTSGRDYDADGLVFITDGTNHDILEIASVSGSSITTKTGALHGYAAGARIAPARLGLLDDKMSWGRLTNQIENLRVAWSLLPEQISTHRREADSFAVYRGVEVFDVSNDYSDDISVAQSIAQDRSDNGVGRIRDITVGGQRPRRTYSFKELRDRSELAGFIDWVYRRRGRLNPFWFVERVPSYFLHTDALAAATTIVVTSEGYAQYAFSTSRKDIAIRASTGWLYRRVTGASDNGDGTETLTLDSSLGVALTVAENPMISLMKFVRLDQDMVEMSYESTNIIRTATAFTELLTNN